MFCHASCYNSIDVYSGINDTAKSLAADTFPPLHVISWHDSQLCASVHCSLQRWEVNVRRREQCCWLIVDEHEHSCVWMNTGEICYSVWRRRSLWRTAQINLEILFSSVMLRTVEEMGRGKPLRAAERPVPLFIWMLLLLPASQGPFFTWLQQPGGKPNQNRTHSTVFVGICKRNISK